MGVDGGGGGGGRRPSSLLLMTGPYSSDSTYKDVFSEPTSLPCGASSPVKRGPVSVADPLGRGVVDDKPFSPPVWTSRCL